MRHLLSAFFLFTACSSAHATTPSKADCERLEKNFYGKTNGPGSDRRMSECLKDMSREQINCIIAAKSPAQLKECKNK